MRAMYSVYLDCEVCTQIGAERNVWLNACGNWMMFLQQYDSEYE